MRAWVLVVALLLLAGCTGGGYSSGKGSGINPIVLNHQELRDLYFPGIPGSATTTEFIGYDGDYVELSRLSMLVKNDGYADTLAAIYISGFDPNLFQVVPLGPYVLQEGARYCYKDVIIESGQSFQGYMMCAAADDVFFGGGVVIDNGVESVRIDAYNLNVGDYLNSVVSWMTKEETTLFGDLGLFNDLNVNCQAGGNPSGSGVTIGGGNTQCSISWNAPALFWERSSRGQLLLAMHGGAVRECRNDCTVVPSPLMPKKYISGDSEQYPGGEGMYVDYGIVLNRGRWPPNLNDHEQLFQITTCYLYTTYLTPIVCVDPTPGTYDGEACRAGVLQMGEAQPAPLTITSIEQHNQGSQVAFTIHVKNVWGGTAFDPGAIDFCAPNSPDTYARQLREVAKVVDARVLGSLESLDCRDGVIRLYNGQGQITCTYNLPPEAFGRGAYQSTLNIEIGYLYRDIQTIRSTIHRI